MLKIMVQYSRESDGNNCANSVAW